MPAFGVSQSCKSTFRFSNAAFVASDVTVGSWMLAFNVSHFDDRRMCAPACGPTAVAVYDFPKCALLLGVYTCAHLQRVMILAAAPLPSRCTTSQVRAANYVKGT